MVVRAIACTHICVGVLYVHHALVFVDGSGDIVYVGVYVYAFHSS